MTRVDCPYCGRIGSLYQERIIRGREVPLTTYFCDACSSEWDEREDDAVPPKHPRKRAPKTRHDKSLEP